MSPAQDNAIVPVVSSLSRVSGEMVIVYSLRAISLFAEEPGPG
jgi:hypothetical protein